MKKIRIGGCNQSAITLLAALSTLNQEKARADSDADEPNIILDKQCTKIWSCILLLSSI